MPITRRDFLNGVALTVAAGLTPLELLQAAGHATMLDGDAQYPPALMGLRGNHPGSFENAHALGREHENFNFDALPVEEGFVLEEPHGGGGGAAGAGVGLCRVRELLGKRRHRGITGGELGRCGAV